jgi:hypothetical protein
MVTLSPGEKRMAQYVSHEPDMAEETPEEKNARLNRNWTEIKKARIAALKSRDPKAVGILDQELAAGRGTDFPDDAFVEDDGFVADDDGFVPDAKPVQKFGSQADVRKSEPSMALIEQEAAERGWENARKDWVQKTGGVVLPGKTQAQTVTEFSGKRNPLETRQDAQAQHAVDTGELVYGDSVEYNLAKPAASIAGFAAAGPVGATVAEALVRGVAVGYNVDKALDKGMDPDQATDIIVNEMVKGVAVDSLFNFGAPLVAQLIGKIPGLRRIGDKITAKLAQLGAPKPRAPLREAEIASRKAATDNPVRQQAVEELAKRMDDGYLPTKGQVRGKTGFLERRAYEAFPAEFEAAEQSMAKGAEQLRKEVVSPNSQPAAQQLGEQIDRFVGETVKATKDRLRPVFEAANNAKMVVDQKPIVDVAREALKKNSSVLGRGKLTEAEVGHLKKIVEGYRMQPWRDAESTLDFLSVQKEMLRKLNVDGNPSKFFSIVVGDIEKAAKGSFDEGARRMGETSLVKRLEEAWRDYRIMNESAYTGAMKQVLKKGDDAAEDIGSYLWAKGKVSRIDDLDEMLKLGGREGVASPQAIEKLRRNVARGFVRQGVQTVEQAANWSKSLADPERKATWDALTRAPGGQELKDTMLLLEQAAQIATVQPANRQSRFFGVPFSRAIGGGLGFSWVTGAISPVIAGIGLSAAGAVRLATTAMAHGDKGTLNLLKKVLRSNNVGTAASAKALEVLLPQLKEAADKYGEDPFLREDVSKAMDSAVRATDDPLGVRKAVTGAKK